MTGDQPAGMPSSSVLKSYLDTVYGIQTNVFMTVLPGTTNTVNYDLDGNGALFDRWLNRHRDYRRKRY